MPAFGPETGKKGTLLCCSCLPLCQFLMKPRPTCVKAGAVPWFPMRRRVNLPASAIRMGQVGIMVDLLCHAQMPFQDRKLPLGHLADLAVTFGDFVAKLLDVPGMVFHHVVGKFAVELVAAHPRQLALLLRGFRSRAVVRLQAEAAPHGQHFRASLGVIAHERGAIVPYAAAAAALLRDAAEHHFRIVALKRLLQEFARAVREGGASEQKNATGAKNGALCHEDLRGEDVMEQRSRVECVPASPGVACEAMRAVTMRVDSITVARERARQQGESVGVKGLQ